MSNTARKEHTGLDCGAGGRLCCCMLLENSDLSVFPPVHSSIVKFINVELGGSNEREGRLSPYRQGPVSVLTEHQ